MKKLLSSGGGTDSGGSGAGDGGGGSPAAPPPDTTVVKEGRSVFHTKLVTNASPPDMDACVESVRAYVAALERFCGAGSHAAAQFSGLLGATAYSGVATQFSALCREVEGAVAPEGAAVQTDVETLWAQLGRSYEGEEANDDDSTISQDIKLVAKSLVRVMQMHCQFFLTTSEVFGQFAKVNSLDDLTHGASPDDASRSEDATPTNAPTQAELTQSKPTTSDSAPPPPETTTANKNLELKSPSNADSPSRLRKHISSFFSKKLGGGSGKSGSGSGDASTSSQSSFYVQTPHEDDEAPASGEAVDPETRGGATAEDGKEKEQVAGAGPSDAAAAGDTSSPDTGAEAANNSSGVNGSAGQAESKSGGHLASQEELENVIDLLSGFPKFPSSTHAPSSSLSQHGHHGNVDGLPPKHPYAPTATTLSTQSKAVGSHLSHAPPPGAHPSPLATAGFPSHMFSHPPPQLPPTAAADPSYDPGLLGVRTHQHRRSDGLIGETIHRVNHKTNTWPHRPHRMADAAAASSVNASVGGVPFSQPPVGAYDGHVSDAEYSRYLAAVRHMKQNSHGGTGGGSNPLLPHNSPWSSGDTNFNRSWPLHMFPQDGQHEGGGPRGAWPGGVGDSSSCSDESSNGETPWMMGIDLVNSIDKRRHSSGDESYPSGPVSTNDSRPHSVEDLLVGSHLISDQETKTNNTWPGPMKQQQQQQQQPQQQQQWGKGAMAPPGGVEPNPLSSHLHPPLQMQWSDPLTNRPLTTWGSGLTGAMSHQSLQMYTGLAGGALPDQVGAPPPPPPPPHPNMDTSYSIMS